MQYSDQQKIIWLLARRRLLGSASVEHVLPSSTWASHDGTKHCGLPMGSFLRHLSVTPKRPSSSLDRLRAFVLELSLRFSHSTCSITLESGFALTSLAADFASVSIVCRLCFHISRLPALPSLQQAAGFAFTSMPAGFAFTSTGRRLRLHVNARQLRLHINQTGPPSLHRPPASPSLQLAVSFAFALIAAGSACTLIGYWLRVHLNRPPALPYSLRQKSLFSFFICLESSAIRKG